jgi:RHS repeat-associated protein
MHPNGRVTPNPCDQDIHVAGQLNGTNDYLANTISSDANIQTGATVFEAKAEIVLQADFEVELGAAFTADIIPCNGAAAWQYEYFLQDHLGNNRILFADLNNDGSVDASEILQETHYYAFGMEMEGDWQATTLGPDQRYRFNGKEFSEELGLYDYGARWYDPAVARWGQVDPLAESNNSFSPYNYVLNNPILLIDPDGRDTSFADNGAREQFNNTYSGIEKSIEKLAGKKQTKSRSGKIERLKELKQSFDDVISSETTFNFISKPNPDGATSGGSTGFNTETGEVDVSFYEDLDATLVHETRHAAGYERGEWGWDTQKDEPTYYDYQDEYEGYRAGAIYESGGANVNVKSLQREVMSIYSSGQNKVIIRKFKQVKVPKR